MVGVLLLIVGGFNAGLVVLTGKDMISTLLGRRSIMTNALFLGMGIAALSLAFCRDFYLPFLGQTVMPCSLLTEHTPEGADTSVRVQVRPGAKVMYWAAEPENAELKEIQDWRKAYLGFRNAGVAIANEDGIAELKVRKPQAYSVPLKGTLEAHVHYRVCGDDGMMDRVETTFVGAAGTEGFMDTFEAAEPPSVIEPNHAVAEINATAKKTAAESLMAESGALDEAESMFRGAELGQAF